MLLCHSLQRGTTFVDFLFAFPKNKALPKGGLLLKERICSYGMGGKIKIKELLALKMCQKTSKQTLFERTLCMHCKWTNQPVYHFLDFPGSIEK